MSDDTMSDVADVQAQMQKTFGSGSETHFRYVTKENLRRLNNQAIENNLNRSIEPNFVEKITEKFDDGREVKYAITNKILHNDKEWRCWFPVLVDDNLLDVYLDISLVEYEALPTVEMITTQPNLNS
tara:strand:+ start:554 stop:934 length:381 start_codon:yes stop_codon:yes gene_type:complete